MGVSRYEAHNGKKLRVAPAGYHDGMFVKGLLLDLDGRLTLVTRGGRKLIFSAPK